MQAAFVQWLQKEFEARKARNPKYSLRAFAQFLEVDHASLSQMLRLQRAVPAGTIDAWSRNLGLDPSDAHMYASAEPWAAQASEILDDPGPWALICLARAPDFVGNSAWIAVRLGVSVDHANIIIARLLRVQMIRMDGAQPWARTAPTTEREFRKQVIERLRSCPTL